MVEKGQNSSCFYWCGGGDGLGKSMGKASVTKQFLRSILAGTRASISVLFVLSSSPRYDYTTDCLSRLLPTDTLALMFGTIMSKLL